MIARALGGLISRQPLWGGLLVVLLAVVSALAWTPGDPQIGLSTWDKLNHLAAFAALGAVATLWRGPQPGAWRAVALGLLAYGVLIEWVQTGIAGRSGDLADVVADALGLVLGLLVGRQLLLLPTGDNATR